MTEPVAWLVAAIAGLATLYGVIVLTRPLRSGFLKVWLRCMAAVLLLLPAPVPGFDAYYAPAFVVALFEATLQRDGQPASAMGLLLAVIVVVTVLVWLVFLLRRRGRWPGDG